MNATINPVKGFKIELTYSSELIASAIAAQVSMWVNGLVSSFLRLCEATLSQGYQARVHVNGKVIQAREVGGERLREATTQAQALAVDLSIATLRHIKRPVLGLVLPRVNTLIEYYLGLRNTVQSALTAYIEGAAGGPIHVNVVAQGSVLLPSVEAALDGQELLVPNSDDEVIAEATSKHLVDMEAEESQSLPLSNDRLKVLEGDQENGEETGVATPKRRGRRRSA